MSEDPGKSVPLGRWMSEGLVIITSILIAFSIDAWWDERQEADQVGRAAVSLLVEVRDNLDRLAERRTEWESAIESLDRLQRAIIGVEPIDDSAERFGALLPVTDYQSFNPGTTAFDAALQSGTWTLMPLGVQIDLPAFVSGARQAVGYGDYVQRMTLRMIERLEEYGGLAGFVPEGARPDLGSWEADGDWAGLLQDPALETAALTARVAYANDVNRIANWEERLLRVELELLDLVSPELLAEVEARNDAESVAVTAPDTLRVLAYNIHHGEGMDSILDLQRIAELILEVDPDVVTLQEVDSVATRTGDVDQAAELGRLTGMTPVYGSFMPYQGGAYGMAILSRWPVRSTHNHRLPDGTEPRTALEAVIASPTTGREVRIVGIHFYRTEVERAAQADSLDARLARGPDSGLPTLLAGDFNSEPGTRVIEDRARRWRIVDKGADHLTFASYDPDREIDFVMYQPADAFRVIEQRLLDEPVISDHRPVVVVFEVGREES